MFYKKKKILVIGGTGEIGRKIIEKLMVEEPELIRLFSRDEHKQYLLDNELGSNSRLEFMIGDVRDYDRVLSAMQGIDYVFHLAAMKHVPSCEFNPYEAVQTNIHGTYHVVRAANEQNVKKVIFTSSDKAISPTNTYGSTKLIAERLITATEHSSGKGDTVFASVRFGNVMGSRGSVIPLFKKQILDHSKITVTDHNMTRFMMTLNQATDLTMKALQEANGGEVFVLKMPVIRLKDLSTIVVEEMCQKHQLDSNQIIIEEHGLRPGEKMYEELMTYDESTTALDLGDMFVIPGQGVMDDQTYAEASRVEYGTYSSSQQKPLKLEELRVLLMKEKLF
ncbi:SDR family NAD(P)-dependent oxidoreductase [Tenuibacillus multivorans]|uniref:Polysaccharide biosynthesis protein n=1 Tax=Tenuibacillus multivorans TaxID=237069 RepID=A0A1G9YNV6_9BACI|nr:SDR family NAD(P)-dependent oxidoreductase [Tenuibacillus multivorans]GEL78487.1 membrane protein [Tenuibacillus multivorans]SDN10672.1 Polysaccharide biosynthesis protein [Tenuibacillus multivorans]